MRKLLGGLQNCAVIVLPGLLPLLQAIPKNSLNTLLTRANTIEVNYEPLDHRLFHYFGLMPPDPVPSAAVMRLAHSNAEDAEYHWWLRADPVHYVLDAADVYIHGNHGVNIEYDEANELMALVEPLLPQGSQLMMDESHEWYLNLAEDPGIRTHNLNDVVGERLYQVRPLGPKQAYWQKLAAEIEMAWHHSKVNQIRKRLGKPMINGIWFWGEGQHLEPQIAKVKWQSIQSHHRLVQGLGSLTQQKVLMEPEDLFEFQQRKASGAHLIVNDGLQVANFLNDADTWQTYLHKLDENWFNPLLGAIQKGYLSHIIIDPIDDHLLVIDKWALLKFWRRKHGYRIKTDCEDEAS